MDPRPEFNRPDYYQFRVRGRLSPQSQTWFEGIKLSVDQSSVPVQTVLEGYIADQAALYGMISRIRDLGLTLISVNRLDQEEEV